jgi:hypothetical protein
LKKAKLVPSNGKTATSWHKFCCFFVSGNRCAHFIHGGELMSSSSAEVDRHAAAFYRNVLETLNGSGIPYLVGGAYAFNQYTALSRHTKDLDIFIRRQDYLRLDDALLSAGYKTELTYPHWLGKIYAGDEFIDLIFSSGNGVAKVDDEWFDHAIHGEVLGVPAKLCPAEEMIWSKAFIMERERYDGADIVHLIRARNGQLDWQRLLRRFGPHWRILFNHLVLFGFVYPAHRNLVPAWVMLELIERLRDELRTPPPEDNICLGPLLSREQYLADIGEWGYQDARLAPLGSMTEHETSCWTEAIPKNKHEPS